MQLRVLLLAGSALALVHPGVHAQSSGGPPDPAAGRVVVTHRTAASPPPSWGFAFGMRAGPRLEYTHPYVTEVVKGSTAEEAGLAVGDTILSVDGRDTRQPPMFPDESPGVRHLMRIRRAGEEMELTFVMPATAARSQARPRMPAAHPE